VNTNNRGKAEIELTRTARRVLPAGGFGNMDGDIIIRAGRGGRVWDVSGNKYVDLLLGSGPMLVGHAHPEVVAAVRDQVERGTTFFVSNEHGILLAEELVRAIPCADQVRFVSSGSEADLYAMRLARAYRKRDKILKFEGGYHGMSDYGLMSLWPKGPRDIPNATPDSAGIPRSVRNDILVAPFNDLETAEKLIRAHRDDLAGVIVEPVQRVVAPKPGFLEGLRACTKEQGIPLIFDEVVTGFRFTYGGAQSYFGVVPDICTLGKIIGGGFPLAAIAGRADIMAHFDRSAVGDGGYTPQIGTLSGNPVAAVAGLATLNILRRPGTYERIFATGRTLMNGLSAALREVEVEAQLIGVAPMFDVVFTGREVSDYRGTLQGDPERARRFNTLLRAHGVLKGESKHYVSLAHDEADVRATLRAFTAAAHGLAEARAA
jgi:glutamate-1-semialdehyde 2,1-aminomutase